MGTTKYVLFAALGAAAVLLLKSEKVKDLSEQMRDKAMKNAKKWKSRLSKIGGDTTETLEDLRKLLKSEVAGLSDDARQRIEHILDGSANSAAKLKKSVAQA